MEKGQPIIYRPIGVIHSPLKSRQGAPIQASLAKDITGTVELRPEYEPGLLDIEGFSHLILLYHFHLSEDYDLRPIPFIDNKPHGVFAIRAPKRPNPIGLSIVRLERCEGQFLHISEVDIIDQTPLLDIKPYVPAFDHRPGARSGWIEPYIQKGEYRTVADDRFK